MAACAALATAGIAGCGGTDDGGGDDGLEPVEDGGDDGGGDDGGGGGPDPVDPVGPPPVQPPDNPDPPPVEELETYTNDQWGFSIQYPAAWGRQEQSEEWALSVYFFPEEQDAFLSVNIVVNEETTLEDVITSTQQSFQEVGGWEILEERRTNLPGGQEAWIADVEFRQTYSDDGSEYELALRSKLLLTADDDRFFIVEMGTFQDQYSEEFDGRADEVLESLDIE